MHVSDKVDVSREDGTCTVAASIPLVLYIINLNIYCIYFDLLGEEYLSSHRYIR